MSTAHPVLDEPRPDERPAAWGLTRLPRGERPEPISGDLPVLGQRALTDRSMALTLHAPDIAGRALPGQFVMLTAARRGEKTPALPRPMAIYATDAVAGTIEVVYGIIGEGTRRLSTFGAGELMHVVGPLGQPFEVPESAQSILLIGRGIGTCSLTTVAPHAQRLGIPIAAVTSARSRAALIGAEYYRAQGVHTVFEVTDDEGTSTPESLHETLTRAFDDAPADLILTCGSRRLTALAETLAERWSARVQVSVEAHMACGLGYCHGCASGARSVGAESPLICHDGPAFDWRPLGGVEA